jgi:hypothetical protein
MNEPTEYEAQCLTDIVKPAISIEFGGKFKNCSIEPHDTYYAIKCDVFTSAINVAESYSKSKRIETSLKESGYSILSVVGRSSYLTYNGYETYTLTVNIKPNYTLSAKMRDYKLKRLI